LRVHTSIAVRVLVSNSSLSTKVIRYRHATVYMPQIHVRRIPGLLFISFRPSYHIGLTLFGVFIAQGKHKSGVQPLINSPWIHPVILYLRTIALWARNRWILWLLGTLAVVGLSFHLITTAVTYQFNRVPSRPVLYSSKSTPIVFVVGLENSECPFVLTHHIFSCHRQSKFPHRMYHDLFKPECILRLHPAFYFGNEWVKSTSSWLWFRSKCILDSRRRPHTD
jgi:hypothetical protein